MVKDSLTLLVAPLIHQNIITFHIFGGNSHTAYFFVSKFLSKYYSNYFILACIFPRHYATVEY